MNLTYLTCIIRRHTVELGMFIVNNKMYNFTLLATMNNTFSIEGRLFNVYALNRAMHTYCATGFILIALEGNELHESIGLTKHSSDNVCIDNNYMMQTIPLDDHRSYYVKCPWSLSLQYYIWALGYRYTLLLCTTINRAYLSLCSETQKVTKLEQLEQLVGQYYDSNNKHIHSSHYGLFMLRDACEAY